MFVPCDVALADDALTSVESDIVELLARGQRPRRSLAVILRLNEGPLQRTLVSLTERGGIAPIAPDRLVDWCLTQDGRKEWLRRAERQ